jgi:hypothetical protein
LVVVTTKDVKGDDVGILDAMFTGETKTRLCRGCRRAGSRKLTDLTRIKTCSEAAPATRRRSSSVDLSSSDIQARRKSAPAKVVWSPGSSTWSAAHVLKVDAKGGFCVAIESAATGAAPMIVQIGTEGQKAGLCAGDTLVALEIGDIMVDVCGMPTDAILGLLSNTLEATFHVRHTKHKDRNSANTTSEYMPSKLAKNAEQRDQLHSCSIRETTGIRENTGPATAGVGIITAANIRRSLSTAVSEGALNAQGRYTAGVDARKAAAVAVDATQPAAVDVREATGTKIGQREGDSAVGLTEGSGALSDLEQQRRRIQEMVQQMKQQQMELEASQAGAQQLRVAATRNQEQQQRHQLQGVALGFLAGVVTTWLVGSIKLLRN